MGTSLGGASSRAGQVESGLGSAWGWLVTPVPPSADVSASRSGNPECVVIGYSKLELPTNSRSRTWAVPRKQRRRSRRGQAPGFLSRLSSSRQPTRHPVCCRCGEGQPAIRKTKVLLLLYTQPGMLWIRPRHWLYRETAADLGFVGGPWQGPCPPSQEGIGKPHDDQSWSGALGRGEGLVQRAGRAGTCMRDAGQNIQRGPVLRARQGNNHAGYDGHRAHTLVDGPMRPFVPAYHPLGS